MKCIITWKLVLKWPRHRWTFPDFKWNKCWFWETFVSKPVCVHRCSRYSYTNYLHARTSFSGSKNLAIERSTRTRETTKHKCQWKEERKRKREHRESKLLRLTNTKIFQNNFHNIVEIKLPPSFILIEKRKKKTNANQDILFAFITKKSKLN